MYPAGASLNVLETISLRNLGGKGQVTETFRLNRKKRQLAEDMMLTVVVATELDEQMPNHVF